MRGLRCPGTAPWSRDTPVPSHRPVLRASSIAHPQDTTPPPPPPAAKPHGGRTLRTCPLQIPLSHGKIQIYRYLFIDSEIRCQLPLPLCLLFPYPPALCLAWARDCRAAPGHFKVIPKSPSFLFALFHAVFGCVAATRLSETSKHDAGSCHPAPSLPTPQRTGSTRKPDPFGGGDCKPGSRGDCSCRSSSNPSLTAQPRREREEKDATCKPSRPLGTVLGKFKRFTSPPAAARVWGGGCQKH